MWDRLASADHPEADTESADHTHVEHVGAERGDATVGKDEGLTGDDDDHDAASSHDPSRTAASAAPRKWPLVPPATGKFSICAAKMNAAVTPSRGTLFSSSVRPARRTP